MVMEMMRAGSASCSRGVATTATTAATSLGKWWPTTQPPPPRTSAGLQPHAGRQAYQLGTLYLPKHAKNVLTRTTKSWHASGASAHQDEAAPEAQSLRRWRTALDYCGPSMEGQRTRVLTRSPATTQAHEECADSDAPTSRARRRLEEVHQLGHPSPDRKDPRLAQANSTNPSRPLDDAALAPQWMETTNTKAAPTTASLPVRLVSHARDVVRSSLPGGLYAA